MIDVTSIVSDVGDTEDELSMADIVTSLTDAVPGVEVRYHRTGSPVGFTVATDDEARQVEAWAHRMLGSTALATADDAKRMIRQIIEPWESPENVDIGRVFTECFEYDPERGYVQTATVARFWLAVQAATS